MTNIVVNDRVTLAVDPAADDAGVTLTTFRNGSQTERVRLSKSDTDQLSAAFDANIRG